MKLKLLASAALLACGTGAAKADSLSISIGSPPAYVHYNDYAPVYHEHHHHHYERHYAPPRVVYYQPQVAYRDVHHYHARGDHRYCDHGRHGRGHDDRDDHHGHRGH